ncbi:VOC family protein [Candidatus Gottesmanbacteria bacterium]|nr:VOC family protein [Candidatus Gottesmanbacteria bacterium]
MNPVVHFEMPYKNGSRAAKFYESAFNWKMTDAGEKMGNYLLATTTDTDEKGMVKKPGTINGGFYPLEAAKDAKEPSVVVAVDNIEESMGKIKEAGGKLLGTPTDIPGVGKYVPFVDTEGNRVSILQPTGM